MRTARDAAWEEQAKQKGAVLKVEGAGSVLCNGYYKEHGASASLPSVIANEDNKIDNMMMTISCPSRASAGSIGGLAK